MGTGSGLPTQALARNPLPKPSPHVLSSRLPHPACTPALARALTPTFTPALTCTRMHTRTHARTRTRARIPARTHPLAPSHPRTHHPRHPCAAWQAAGFAAASVRTEVVSSAASLKAPAHMIICMRRCTSCMRARTHAHTHPLRLFRRSTTSTRCSPPPPLAAPPARNGTCMAYAWPMAHAWHMHGNALGRHRHRAQPRRLARRGSDWRPHPRCRQCAP